MRTEIIKIFGTRSRFLAGVLDLVGGTFARRGAEMACRAERKTVVERAAMVV